jgi:hypothetical protein
VSGHLSEAEVRAYASGRLLPPELLSADEHLATCDACRDRASRIAGLGPAIETLQSDLCTIGSHLSDEEVQLFVADRLPAHALARARAHLSECSLCARQVSELQAWVKRPSFRLTYYAAAAALVFAIVLPTLWFLSSRLEPVAQPSIAGFASLPAPTQERVRKALEAGIVEPPEFLQALAGRRETLMGEAASRPFRVQAPVATAIVTDRPTFEWTPVSVRSRYSVDVFSEDLRLVVRSPQLTETNWTAVEPLERDRTYVWQVTVDYDGQAVTVPASPDPQAKFRVLNQQTSSLLQRAALELPTAHLLLGILYADAGVRVEAERQLREVATSDPHAELARRTLDRLNRF